MKRQAMSFVSRLAVVAAALIPRLDLFIALIGALASSCLAIIFPAIIQMCTFWGQEDEDEDENSEQQQQDGDNNKMDDNHNENLETRRQRRIARRKLLWRLFIFKNILLMVFGILGLITGSWISLSQLSAAYMAIESGV